MTLPLLAGSVRVEELRTLVTLEGSIDPGTRGILDVLLEQALASAASRIDVDMTAVRSCDGAGLAALVGAASIASSSGRRITLQSTFGQSVQQTDLTDVERLLWLSRSSPSALVQGIERSSQTQSRDLLDSALGSIVTLAHAVIPSADGISVTMPRHGVFTTVAASNEVVLQMDHDQYDTGEGPCLDAATDGRSVQVRALDAEPRWPAFIPRARAHGIRSIMSAPLVSANGTLGALNLYSRTEGAFTEASEQWAELFASHAAVIAETADSTQASSTLAQHITNALRSRETVALGQGIVMHRDRVTAEQAHRHLRDLSRTTRRTVHDVCADLVAQSTTAITSELPDGSHRGPSDE